MGKPWPGLTALTNKMGTAACVSHQEETEALGTEVLGGGQRHWGWRQWGVEAQRHGATMR